MRCAARRSASSRTRRATFQRLQRELREDLNQRRNEALAGVQESATRVINQIAEQERFDLILQEAVFASGKIDITDKVIKALADK
jgi:outer membrane protein